MKFAGIIAEYDPFHNGHAWQLAQARALGGAAGGRGHELRAYPAGRAAAVAGGGAGAGGAGLRSRPCVCPARALRLRRCRGFCPGGGAHSGCCRVRCAGLWGRDPGHRPAAKSRPGAVQRSIPHRAETAAFRRGTQLCRCPAGGGAGAVPGGRHRRTAGQAQQQSCRRVLQGYYRTKCRNAAHRPAPAGRRPRAGTDRKCSCSLCQRQCPAGTLGGGRRGGTGTLCAGKGVEIV